MAKQIKFIPQEAYCSVRLNILDLISETSFSPTKVIIELNKDWIEYTKYSHDTDQQEKVKFSEGSFTDFANINLTYPKSEEEIVFAFLKQLNDAALAAELERQLS